MKNSRIKHLVLSSIFAAMVCLATAVFSFPLPGNGFANLGDCFVILCGGIIGSWWGFAAAAVGAALADILLGYAIYAPATFLIKASVAVIGWLLFRILCKVMPKLTILALVMSGILAEIFMVGGYFAFEALFIGYGWGAIAGVPLNMIQGTFGVIVGSALMHLLEKIHLRVHWEYHSK